MSFDFKRTASSLAAVALFGFASAAGAAVLTIQAEAPQTVGPQSASAPCIIAGTNCQNGSFAYTNFDQSGNVSSYNLASPVYSVSDLPFLSFAVAIDVNTANGGEFLNSFTLTDITTATACAQTPTSARAAGSARLDGGNSLGSGNNVPTDTTQRGGNSLGSGN